MLGRGAQSLLLLSLTLFVSAYVAAPIYSQEKPQSPSQTQNQPNASTPATSPTAPEYTIPIDKDRAIFSHIEDRSPIRSETQSPDEYAAYNAVLIHARHVPLAELESHARRDVMYKDLYHSVRKDFKLELVRFEGRLKRLRSIGPTRQLKEAGIDTLYEGWMVPKEQPKFLICFLTTELPEGFEAQHDMTRDKLNVPISISGYFFKLMAYETPEAAKDPKKTPIEYAPLLMGRSIVVLKETGRDPSEDWFSTFLPGLVGGLLAIAAVVVGLSIWYRRGDRKAESAIAARYETNPFA